MNPRQMKTGDIWNSWVQGMKVTPCGFKEAAHGYSATGHPAHLPHGCLNSAPLHDPTNPEKLEPAMMASLAWDPKARSTVAFHSQNSLILNQINTDLAHKIRYGTATEGSKFPGLYLCTPGTSGNLVSHM